MSPLFIFKTSVYLLYRRWYCAKVVENKYGLLILVKRSGNEVMLITYGIHIHTHALILIYKIKSLSTRYYDNISMTVPRIFCIEYQISELLRPYYILLQKCISMHIKKILWYHCKFYYSSNAYLYCFHTSMYWNV